jgi:tetratricopeptide (TPR) repeat protein
MTGLYQSWAIPVLSGITFLLVTPPVQAVPHTPVADTEVLETLPARAADSTSRELTRLRAALTLAPTDSAAATELAQRYFDLAMARGDPRYIGYAEAVVNRFTQALTPELLTLRGMLRQYRHDFGGGLSDFDSALKLDPDHAIAHAWRGAIFLVQADTVAAHLECDALQRLGRATLAGGCRGLALAYGGNLAAGYQALQQALSRSTDEGNRLWLLTRLAEVAAWQGQPLKAEKHYRDALRLDRDDVYLLAAWSDFLLDQGQPAEVVQLLSRWEASDSLLLRLAEAEASLKLPAAARHQQMMVDRFAAARARGDTTHRAEEARFELRLRGDAKTALRLARENYAVQREPRDARVLFEAAVAAQDRNAAQSALDWLSRSGFEDARTRQLARTLTPSAKPAQPGSAP